MDRSLLEVGRLVGFEMGREKSEKVGLLGKDSDVAQAGFCGC